MNVEPNGIEPMTFPTRVSGRSFYLMIVSLDIGYYPRRILHLL